MLLIKLPEIIILYNEHQTPYDLRKKVRYIAARTLFSAEALQSVMRVINLSDEPYNLHKNEQLGEATQAEIWTSGFDTATMPVPSRNAGPADSSGPSNAGPSSSAGPGSAGPSQNVTGGADSHY